jgi:hypothetical protein
MKMLFFSSERTEVERVREELLAIGIACEMRDNSNHVDPAPHCLDVELWIENDADAHRAAMVCVECGVGFAKRPATVRVWEEEEQEEAQGC